MHSPASIHNSTSYSTFKLALRFGAAFVAANGLALPAGANESGCKVGEANLRALDTAIVLYASARNEVPTQSGWFKELVDSGRWSGEPATDLWGRPYAYTRKSSTEYDIRSIGPDGKFGTADDMSKGNDFQTSDCGARRGRTWGCAWRR